MIFAAALISLVLVATSVIIHYESLRLTSGVMRICIRPRQRLLVMISGAFIAHLLEICLFALAYMLMHKQWNMGAIEGAHEGRWEDFFYFSAATYSTLGIGDIFPSGAMRSVVAIEGLAGLVLIGWSTSFTYLSMREFWKLDS